MDRTSENESMVNRKRLSSLLTFYCLLLNRVYLFSQLNIMRTVHAANSMSLTRNSILRASFDGVGKMRFVTPNIKWCENYKKTYIITEKSTPKLLAWKCNRILRKWNNSKTRIILFPQHMPNSDNTTLSHTHTPRYTHTGQSVWLNLNI